MIRVVALSSTLLLGLIAADAAVGQSYDRDVALAVSQDAIGRLLGDHTLRDVNGQPYRTATLHGKPLVVSLIYTSCHHVCPLITRNLAKTVEIARDALGEDSFAVITVGFDWRNDTPERMRIYAAERGIDAEGWYFLSGDAATISALSNSVGFQFFDSAKGFDHLSQTTVVDANGRIYRQVYGQEIEPQMLVEPLKELVFDTPRDAGLMRHWVDSLKLFCTVYDPNTGRYRFDYSIFMTVFVGLLCLGATASFIVREWRQAK